MVKLLKAIALTAVVIVFVLSIVQSVLADSLIDTTVSGDVTVKTNSSKEDRKIRIGITGAAASADAVEGKLAQERDKELLEKKLETVEEIRVEARTRVEKVKERVQEARESYEEARDKYREARENYNEEKSKLLRINALVKACRESGNDSENCVRQKLELKVGVKQHLLKTVFLIERSLEKLTTNVEKQKTLTEEEKQEALTEITELEAKITVQREEIEALSENATAAEYRRATRELKETWQEVRKEQKRIVSLLISNKLDNLVEKHAEYANAMELRIEELSVKGVDTTALVEIQAEFTASVEQLQEDHAKAQELWTEAKRGREVMDEWHAAQMKVREDLMETKAILRRFLAMYKELKATTEVSAEVEANASVEASSSS